MGLLFDIKRYAINDGPGIRITLFLKGCPMSCVWCHNPEGIGKKPVKLYTRKKCIGCQACIVSCVETNYPEMVGRHIEGKNWLVNAVKAEGEAA